MKANEALYKLYLYLTTGNRILNGEYYERKPAKIRFDDKIIEYTRTDAFIEKAISWLKEQDEIIGVSFQEDFLERFQNYMKGE